jgi:hypothetical protein
MRLAPACKQAELPLGDQVLGLHLCFFNNEQAHAMEPKLVNWPSPCAQMQGEPLLDKVPLTPL